MHHQMRNARKVSDLTHKDMALLCGVSDATKFNRVELNKQSIDLETAVAYNFLFDIPIQHIVSDIREEMKQNFLSNAPQLLQELKQEFMPPRKQRRHKYVKDLLDRYSL